MMKKGEGTFWIINGLLIAEISFIIAIFLAIKKIL